MWFGTYDGLNRYDGYDFKIFRHRQGDSTSIVNNWIGVIDEDVQNRLWVGTRNGVSIYDPVHANFRLVPLVSADGKRTGVIDGGISEIQNGPSGDVYIATANHGLLVCPRGRSVAQGIKMHTHEGDVEKYYASAVTFSPSGDIYVSVRDRGIFRLVDAGSALELVTPLLKGGLSLQADDKGRLWIGADDGLLSYDLRSGILKQEFTSANRVVKLSLDHDSLWIASDGDGLLFKRIDSGGVRTLYSAGDRSGISSSSVYSIFRDKEQRTWIGTLRGGINIIDGRKDGFLRLVHDPLDGNSLVNNFVLSCAEEASGNLWIGTDGGGVSYYNRSTGRYNNYTSRSGTLSNDFVTAVLNDKHDETWIASWGGGVSRFNRKTKRFDRLVCEGSRQGQEDKAIWSLYEDKSGDIWAGACVDGALYRLNRQANRFEAFDTTLRNMVTLFEDAEGQLWGGDYYCLVRIDRVHKKHVRYPIGFSVRSMYEDAEHNLWVGTEGNGLLLFDRGSGKYYSYTEDNGLSNNAVLQIIPDGKGSLWLSTFKGISVFSILTRRINSIFQSDGLLSNQLSYHGATMLRSGEFAFGGIKGLNIFFPENIRPAHEIHKVLLSNLTINNTPVEKNPSFVTSADHDGIGAIRLPFDKAVLSLTFVTPEYSTPDKLSYAYYLEGWDKDWNYPGKNRTATYTRLSEGSYVFKVKVADAFGSWSGAETLVNIVVLPPWYRTWWAYVLYVLITAGGIYIFFHYRSRQLRLQYEVAVAQTTVEREKELNERKLSFFTDVAHEFRSPLTLIVGPMKELVQRFEHKPESKELNTVYRNAKRLLSLVNQLLLFRKADAEEDSLIVQKINLYDLCSEVYSCFWQQARVKNIKYELIGDMRDLEVFGDYEKLEIVLFNLISNALKYTPDGGTVSVKVSETALTAEIVIEDSGCGIDPGQDIFRKFYRTKGGQARSGFGIGLYLAKKFTQSHKGLLTYKSSLGAGTIFCLSLKKGFSHLNDDLTESVIKGKPQLIEELSEDFLSGQAEAPALSSVVEEKATVPEDFLYGRRTILVVDDDPEVRLYLRQILSLSYFVKEAPDGETALEMVFEQAPDLIISDIMMKELNGIELCRKVKEHQALTHVPIILLTSSSSDEIKLNGIKCGADDYITKPFDRLFLLARIDNIFKSRNAMQQYFLDTITLQKVTPKVSAEYRVFLQRCIEVVEAHIDKDDFSIKLLAKEIGMSHSSLYKKIKFISGVSAASFVRFIRLRRAAVLMLTTNVNVNEVAFQVGVNDTKYFREQFKKLFGMNPSEYIKHYRHSFNNDFSLTGEGDL